MPCSFLLRGLLGPGSLALPGRAPGQSAGLAASGCDDPARVSTKKEKMASGTVPAGTRVAAYVRRAGDRLDYGARGEVRSRNLRDPGAAATPPARDLHRCAFYRCACGWPRTDRPGRCGLVS